MGIKMVQINLKAYPQDLKTSWDILSEATENKSVWAFQYLYKLPICCLTSSSLVLGLLEKHVRVFWTGNPVNFWQKWSLWLLSIFTVHAISCSLGFFSPLRHKVTTSLFIAQSIHLFSDLILFDSSLK